MKLHELAYRTATAMGESLLLECQPEESPFPRIEDRVRILAPGILSRLIVESPWQALASSAKKLTATPVISDGKAVITLPDDYLRIVCLKMSDWGRPVFNALLPGDEKALSQTSKWEGVRGCRNRPVAVETIGSEGRKILELYPGNAEASLEIGLYMPRPEWDENEDMAIPGALLPKMLCELKTSPLPL